MPNDINPHFKPQQRINPSVDQIVEGILSGDRHMLSYAITLVESTTDLDQEKAIGVITKINQKSNHQAIKIAITGAPGAGKSTLIDAFGMYLIQQNFKVAVLAIDPSSNATKGSILGDKTRMSSLAVNPMAYVRPSAAGSMLGGVSFGTKENLRLCEAFGFDFILVETVGVGQSEVLASMITDCTCLVLQPGAGDELQGLKRGVVEEADILLVNKADGEMASLAHRSQKHYASSLALFHHPVSGYKPPVLLTSAVEGKGFDQLLQQIQTYVALLKSKNLFENKRNDQEKYWFDMGLQHTLSNVFLKEETIKQFILSLHRKMETNEISAFIASQQLVQLIKNLLRK